MVRLIGIIPQVLVVSSVAGAGYYLSKRLGPAAETSEARVRDWFGELKKLAVKMILVAPCWEELIFRAPLVIVFGDLSPTAWIMITHGAVLFGLMHVNVLHPYHFTALPATARRARIHKAAHFTQTTALGFVFGYTAVASGSLFVPVIIHALWNSGVIILQGIVAASGYRRVHEGTNVEEISPGQGFFLHLKEGISQAVYRTILYESGFSNIVRVGSEFDLLDDNDGSATKFRVYKILKTKVGVSVYAARKSQAG